LENGNELKDRRGTRDSNLKTQKETMGWRGAVVITNQRRPGEKWSRGGE